LIEVVYERVELARFQNKKRGSQKSKVRLSGQPPALPPPGKGNGDNGTKCDADAKPDTESPKTVTIVCGISMWSRWKWA